MKELIGKYYGQDKVEGVVKSEEKSYLGNEKVILKFKESEFELPLAVALKATSEKPRDHTDLTRARGKIALEQTMALMTDAELTIEEITYLMPFIDASMKMNIDMADEKLWGKPTTKRTLLDVNKVLIPEKFKNEDTKVDTKGEDGNRKPPGESVPTGRVGPQKPVPGPKAGR